MPAVSAPVSASARTEGICGELVPRNCCRAYRVCLSGGAFFCFTPLANEHAGTASEPRPRGCLGKP